MKIDEAIKLLNAIAGDIDVGESDEDLDALKLGIEGLKRHQDMERQSYPEAYPPLLGETED